MVGSRDWRAIHPSVTCSAVRLTLLESLRIIYEILFAGDQSISATDRRTLNG